jgi:Arc/MetJ-type ribon-helix-helix transcriptional regulator
VIKLTTEEYSKEPQPESARPTPAPPPPDPKNWYKHPEIAKRLEVEHKWLVQRYRVESSAAPDGKVVFRLMPKGEYQDVVFYLACGPGFPVKAPVAFLVVRGDRYPLLSPALNEWTEDKWLYEVADDLVKWQVKLLDQQVAAAKEAVEQGNYKDASDRLAMVLLINPRMPGAARLLARAESEMAGESDA